MFTMMRNVQVYSKPVSINSPIIFSANSRQFPASSRGFIGSFRTDFSVDAAELIAAADRRRATRQLSTKDIKVTSAVGEITDSDLVGSSVKNTNFNLNSHFNIKSNINNNNDNNNRNSDNNVNLADSLLSKMYNEIITTRLHSLLQGVHQTNPHHPTQIKTDTFLSASFADSTSIISSNSDSLSEASANDYTASANIADADSADKIADFDEVLLQPAVTQIPLQEFMHLPGLDNF